MQLKLDQSQLNLDLDGLIALNNLSDVNSLAPSNGSVLTYNNGAWSPGTVAAGISTLLELTDTPNVNTNNTVLVGNGTAYTAVDFKTSELTDVSTSAPANDQVLMWKSSVGKYLPQTLPDSGGAGSTTLAGLTDTGISGVGNGQVLTWDNGMWRNRDAATAGEPVTTLSGLLDTAITAQTVDQVLAWNGTTWVNADPATAPDSGVVELNDLSDVDFSTEPYLSQVMQHDGTDWDVRDMFKFGDLKDVDLTRATLDVNSIPIYDTVAKDWVHAPISTNILAAASGYEPTRKAVRTLYKRNSNGQYNAVTIPGGAWQIAIWFDRSNLETGPYANALDYTFLYHRTYLEIYDGYGTYHTKLIDDSNAEVPGLHAFTGGIVRGCINGYVRIVNYSLVNKATISLIPFSDMANTSTQQSIYPVDSTHSITRTLPNYP